MAEPKRQKPYLRTAELARSAGVHPNTVRRYTDAGLIPTAERNPKGYRLFTPHHLACLRIAALIYRNTYPGRGIRTSAHAVLVQANAGNWVGALEKSFAHFAFVEVEQARAEAAVVAIAEWHATREMAGGSSGILIGKVATVLDVSIDMLRNWERNGLLAVTRRAANGYRLYGSAEMQRLRVIRALTKAGYSQMAILRMLTQLDQGAIHTVSAIRQVLDTPRPQDDVYIATDYWLSTLAEQAQVAQRLIALVQAVIP